MGIRFFCPNGHKLNVKDFQAGQTGICPFCGVKMPIPLQSTRRSSKRRRSLQEGGGEAVGVLASQTAEGDSPIFAETKIGTVPAETKIERVPADTKIGRVPSNRVTSRDPLAEAGDAVWYVHPPSGGQFGPAAAELMRAWIAEGRISVDSLVWHEGWQNWRTAGRVFPQLSLSAAISGRNPNTPKVMFTSVRSGVAANYRRKRTNTVQVVFVVSLTLAAIILFFILYAIF
jgi:hypothetical protein